LLTAIGALCAAAPALAQSAPADGANSSDSDIVVTGRTKPPTRGEIFEQAQGLSRASRKYDENLARFQMPLCPGVIGFKSEYAAMMIDRIRDNAARLGVPLAKAKCVPNLIVAVVDDSRAALTSLDRNQPQMFALVSDAERNELLQSDGPVRVLTTILTIKSATGAPVEIRDGQEELPSVWGQLNRWFVAFHRDIVSAVVAFDREAVIGKTLVQLADYATMRGLTHTRDATGNEPMPTILSLFAQGSHDTPELTSFDIGYLRSLYSERPDVPAVSRLLNVRWFMARAQKEAGKVATTQSSVAVPAPAPHDPQ
jgi:hypothetical protein